MAYILLISEQKLKAAKVGHKVSTALKEKIKQLLRTEGRLDGKKLRVYSNSSKFRYRNTIALCTTSSKALCRE